MPKRVGVVSISLEAGTAKFMADMDASGAKIRDFASKASGAGHSTRASMIEASAGIRALEGDWNRNIRAVERFLSTTLGLGPVFKTIFPLVGAIATADIIVQLGTKVYDFFKSVRDAGEKSAAAFHGLIAPIQLSNDELARSNVQLENEIAKLQGKHENTLALALAEARVEADKLSEALLKDLESLHKVLAEQNVGIFRQIFGEAPTKDLQELIGGKSGAGAYIAEETKLANQLSDALARATTDEQRKAAETAHNVSLMNLYSEVLEKVNTELAKPSGKTGAAEAPYTTGSQFGAASAGIAQNDEQRRKNLAAMATDIQQQMAKIQISATHEALTDTANKLRAAADSAKLERPFQNELDHLRAELKGVNAELAVVGQSDSARTMAKAFLEADLAIAKINDRLKSMHAQVLTPAQGKQITSLFGDIAAGKDQVEWGNKISDTIKKLQDEAKEQTLLAAAIGKGYEAVKKASVEASVLKDMGAEKYGDPAYAQDQALVRAAELAKYDATHQKSVADIVDKLNDQIELEQALAKAQAAGAEAVRQATLAIKIKQAVDVGATAEQIAAMKELSEAQRENVSATDIAKINERIAATGRLTAAVLLGAEAERKAALETKYAEMERAGAKPEEIQKTKQADIADHNLKITQEALKTGIEYQNQLEILNQQITALKKIKADGNDTLAIEIALRNLENERLKALAQESLAMRGARDGVRAFFIEMQEQAKSSAQIIYDALNSSLDKASANLAKLFIGQKTQWAEMFKEIGTQMLESEIKAGLQKGLGALGKAFGIKGLDSLNKPDGTETNPIWVRIAGGGGPGGLTPALPGGGSIPNLGGKVFGGGNQGGGIFSFLGSLFGGGGGAASASTEAVTSSISFPAMASGGRVESGSAYVVGEAGPELFMPHSSGSIVPHSGAGGATYHIDARGADLGAENRIRRGIEASHKMAVATAVAATHERSRRVPGK